ncbi:BTB/POZ and MATH domain-containing protein 2 [Rhynchospora pubera]|uniref:BTB/POZ and MATH domain-containing protein 2 n=1 Tax=Rhynchospora pubera TaxID=906938 RepID=A0AAV8HSS6_9POAL|nr:BTB/POZ and MATH domain-containing protein 2 [Rhynchospora pubera]
MPSSVADIREPETASTRITRTCTGSHLIKFVGYSFDKGTGVGECISSDTFTLGGYDWSIEYYPDGKKYYEGYLTFDLKLRSTATNVRVKITLTLLSQTGGTPFIRSSSTAVILNCNQSWECQYFVERHKFEASEYLKDDSFTIQCTVTVMECSNLKKTNCKARPFPVQPSNLHQHLISLLERGDGTDVSFKVSGVTFDAHRCVLAARSPVFMAELFGPMKGKVNDSIEIKEMEPSIFKSMLHFIYSDSLPELEEVNGDKDASIALAQHLLVAADRYGLERLKQLCEMKLYEFIDANNLAITLTLAEQHNCAELKATCLEFIKPSEVLAAVVRSEGFEHMIKTCPAILVELRSKSS